MKSRNNRQRASLMKLHNEAVNSRDSELDFFVCSRRGSPASGRILTFDQLLLAVHPGARWNPWIYQISSTGTLSRWGRTYQRMWLAGLIKQDVIDGEQVLSWRLDDIDVLMNEAPRDPRPSWRSPQPSWCESVDQPWKRSSWKRLRLLDW